MTPELVLQAAAQTYENRNTVYGNNYVNVGHVLAAMFPDGVVLSTADDHTRFHLLMLMVVKLTRFANNGCKHKDSIHDTCVYAAMLESIIDAVPKPGEHSGEPLMSSNPRVPAVDAYMGKRTLDEGLLNPCSSPRPGVQR